MFGNNKLNVQGLLTIYSSRRDKHGNVYYAVRLRINDNGHSITGVIGADNIDTLDCREHLHWHIERCELPIREFDYLTKPWEYVGCSWEDIKGSLLRLIHT